MQPDPLFVVRVVSDGPDWVTTALPVIGSTLGVIVGGVATYAATVGTERRKFNDETRHLALSVSAEVQAGMTMLTKVMAMTSALDVHANLDALRYTESGDDPAPITRAAAAKVGRFPEEVAAKIAEYLVLIANMRQQSKTLKAMHIDGALTPERFKQRLGIMTPIANDIMECGNGLVEAIGKRYRNAGRHRRW